MLESKKSEAKKGGDFQDSPENDTPQGRPAGRPAGRQAFSFSLSRAGGRPESKKKDAGQKKGGPGKQKKRKTRTSFSAALRDDVRRSEYFQQEGSLPAGLAAKVVAH